jgi:hypothetical protein
MLAQAGDSLRSALNRAATAEGRVGAAEARATEAEARAIEAEARAKAALQAAAVAQETAGEDPEQLRRAILTAQKAADSAVAEARTEAASIVQGARDEAKKITTDARAAAARMVADAEQAARAAHAAETERAKADIADLSSRRDQLRGDAELLAAHLNAQRERVEGSIVALRGALDQPAVLEPLPVPEKGDPTAASLSAPPSDPEETAAAAALGEGEAAASGAGADEPAPAGDSAPPPAPPESRDAAVGPDEDGDVAGDLASLADEAPAPPTGAAPSDDRRAEAAATFFDQGEPFVDDRWKQGG